MRNITSEDKSINLDILEKIYIFLCMMFCLLIILANLVYRKFVILEIPFLKSLEISAGVLLYPFTFLISDLIAEFYGKRKAIFCIRITMLVCVITAVMITYIDNLKATHWSEINNEVFHKVVGFFSVAFIGSVIASYVSQTLDVYLYLKLILFQ